MELRKNKNLPDNSHEYWEKIYTNDTAVPQYDGILDAYLPTLTKNDVIVDLGCGNGGNAQVLAENGFRPIACDHSEHALCNLKARLPEVRTLCFDMRQPFPLENDSVDFLLADLSIHYFTQDETKTIVAEIRRVLKPGKRFLCRVNAYKELTREKEAVPVEKDYYFCGYHKRYFDCDSLKGYLDGFDVERLENAVTRKYGAEKDTVLCTARKV